MKRRVPFPLGIAILGITILCLCLPDTVSAVGLAPAGPCAKPDELGLSIGAGRPESSADSARGKSGLSQAADSGQTSPTAGGSSGRTATGGSNGPAVTGSSKGPARPGGSSGPALAGGPARHRFAPTSVGAGLPPSNAVLGPPSTAHTSHPGACGSAGSVCGGQVAPNPQAVVRARPTSRNRPRRGPRVVVDPNPGTGCGGAGFGCP